MALVRILPQIMKHIFFLHIVDAIHISSRVISRFRNGLILLRFGGVSLLEVGPSKHFRTNSCGTQEQNFFRSQSCSDG